MVLRQFNYGKIDCKNSIRRNKRKKLKMKSIRAYLSIILIIMNKRMVEITLFLEVDRIYMR